MRGAIAAISPEGVIGRDGTLPWHYSADLKRFKSVTRDTTVIMGRVTWESIGARPLPYRRNVVITRRHLDGVETYPTISAALSECDDPIWFIGGGQLYREALKYCDVIDLTHVPDHIVDDKVVRLPELDPSVWQAGERAPLSTDPRLSLQRYYRYTNRDGGAGRRRVKLDDIEIEYTLTGKSSEKTVVLAHPLGSGQEIFATQVSALEGRFQVLRYDARGHGGSSAGDGVSLEALVADAHGLLAHLELAQVCWIGLGLGACIGRHLAVRHPERIQALVTALWPKDDGERVLCQALSNADGSGLSAEAADRVMKTWLRPWVSPDRVMERRISALLHTADPVTCRTLCEQSRNASGIDIQPPQPHLAMAIEPKAGAGVRFSDQEQGPDEAAFHTSPPKTCGTLLNVCESQWFNGVLLQFLSHHASIAHKTQV